MIQSKTNYFLVFDTNTSYDGFERHFMAFVTGIHDARHYRDVTADMCVLDFLEAVVDSRRKRNELRAAMCDHPTTANTIQPGAAKLWPHPELMVGAAKKMSSVAFRFLNEPEHQWIDLLTSRAIQFCRFRDNYELTGVRLLTQTIQVTSKDLMTSLVSSQ